MPNSKQNWDNQWEWEDAKASMVKINSVLQGEKRMVMVMHDQKG